MPRPDARAAILLSDVHLAEERPGQVNRFLDVLAGPARDAGALYILGDLFEYWVGDDDAASPLAARILQALGDLARAGVAVSLLHGNRDFLIASGFCAQTGVRLMEDPEVLDLHGTRTVLMHGDLLCTDDVAYLAFREQVRDARWQAQFLAQPLAVRHQMARGATAESGRAKAAKHEDIMDVTETAVAAVLRSTGAARLIHGHTHRPGHHLHRVDGRTCERWVLPDWYGAGGYLRVDAAGVSAVTLPG